RDQRYATGYRAFPVLEEIVIVQRLPVGVIVNDEGGPLRWNGLKRLACGGRDLDLLIRHMNGAAWDAAPSLFCVNLYALGDHCEGPGRSELLDLCPRHCHVAGTITMKRHRVLAGSHEFSDEYFAAGERQCVGHVCRFEHARKQDGNQNNKCRKKSQYF